MNVKTNQVKIKILDGDIMISRKYDNNSNIIGNVIENIRKSKKMSRAELSNKLMILGIDINQDGIYKVEKGRRIVKDFELVAFSIVLGISESDLLSDFRKKLLDI